MNIKVFVFLLLSISLFAEDYAVVSNVLVKDISPLEIKAIFLKKLIRVGKKHMVPVNLKSGSKVRKAFEKEILKMGHVRLKSYWMKQHYLGHRPPVTMKSQKSAMKFVKNVQGALTYVNIQNLDSNLKVLYRWSAD
jgi:ABC-type phosphate transport system substrate-binding protein